MNCSATGYDNYIHIRLKPLADKIGQLHLKFGFNTIEIELKVQTSLKVKSLEVVLKTWYWILFSSGLGGSIYG